MAFSHATWTRFPQSRPNQFSRQLVDGNAPPRGAASTFEPPLEDHALAVDSRLSPGSSVLGGGCMAFLLLPDDHSLHPARRFSLYDEIYPSPMLLQSHAVFVVCA